MSLSCDCGYDDDSYDGWWYYGPHDYKTMPPFKRRKRCFSCREFIDPGAVCTEFARARSCGEVEAYIIQDTEARMASWWMCEECSDLFFSLQELGYCFYFSGTKEDSMREHVQEHLRIEEEHREWERRHKEYQEAMEARKRAALRTVQSLPEAWPGGRPPGP